MSASQLSSTASTMSRFLDVEHENSSTLRYAPLRILDRQGELAYEARMDRGSVTSARVSTAQGEVVATVHRRWHSRRIWYVELDGAHFEIRRERFCWTSRSEIFGGPWHVATTRGNFFACLPFEMEHRGRMMARASGRFVAGLAMHRVEMPTDRGQDERVVVAMILALRLQHGDDTD